MTPFGNEEYEESIGTVRWSLAPSNVEIIDSIYFFKNGQFLTKKVIFLGNDSSDRARVINTQRVNFEKFQKCFFTKNFTKDGTIKMTLFCSKEYEESIGTVRWSLAPSNVEIIDSIYFF